MRTAIGAAALTLLAPIRAIRGCIGARNFVWTLLLTLGTGLAPIRAIRGCIGARNFVWVLLLTLGTGLAGCIPTPANLPAQQYYVLNDLAKSGAAQRAAQPGRALLINPTATSPFYDTQSLVFSRAAGQRSYYQFAGWTERPGRRFAELLMRRLEARGAFGLVASTTAGVKGDLLLNTRLEELYQDTSASPGRVQVEVTAELIDYAERTMIARRRFSQSVATGGDNAAAAVNAFNQAVTALLDDVVAWAEAAAARPQAR